MAIFWVVLFMVFFALSIWRIFYEQKLFKEELKPQKKPKPIYKLADLDFFQRHDQLPREDEGDSTRGGYIEGKYITENEAKVFLASNLFELSTNLIEKHKHALYRERSKYTRIDPYGNIFDEGWSKAAKAQEISAIDYFFLNVVKPLIKTEKIGDPAHSSYYGTSPFTKYAYSDLEEWFSYRYGMPYLRWLQQTINEELDKIEISQSVNSNVDQMSGIDYEHYCKGLLEKAGWDVTISKATGDQGVDLVASMDNIRVCIQCKRYSQPVGNKAVQEVVAGKQFYRGTHAAVVSNASFTPSAISLANSTNVLLMSHVELADLTNRIR